MLKHTTVTAQDIMVRRVRTVRPEERVFQASKMLTRAGHSGAPVVDDQHRLVGMLSEVDCIRAFLNAVHHGHPPSLVSDVMTREVISITEDLGILAIADLVVRKKLRRVPVVRGSLLVGLVCRRDVLERAQAIFERSGGREAAILYLSALGRKPPV
jgi:CBS domain-containing protein